MKIPKIKKKKLKKINQLGIVKGVNMILKKNIKKWKPISFIQKETK